MKQFTSLIALLIFIVVAPVKGDGGDETLKSFLSKSDLVVLGKFTREPMGIVDEHGVIDYLCEFQIEDVLKGDANLKDQIIKLSVIRFELVPQDKHPLIKKDSECILYLKKAPPDELPAWVSADYWFGVQHLSSMMASALKRLALP